MARIKHIVLGDDGYGDSHLVIARDDIDLNDDPSPVDLLVDTRLGHGLHVVLDREERLDQGISGAGLQRGAIPGTMRVPTDYPVANVLWNFRENGGSWGNSRAMSTSGHFGNIGNLVFGPMDGKEICGELYFRRVFIGADTSDNTQETTRIGLQEFGADTALADLTNDLAGNLFWQKSPVYNSMGTVADARIIGFNAFERSGADAQVVANRLLPDVKEPLATGANPPALFWYNHIPLGLPSPTRHIVVDIYNPNDVNRPITGVEMQILDENAEVVDTIAMTLTQSQPAADAPFPQPINSAMLRYMAHVPVGMTARVKLNRINDTGPIPVGAHPLRTIHLPAVFYRLPGIDGIAPTDTAGATVRNNNIASTTIDCPSNGIILACGLKFRNGAVPQMTFGIGRINSGVTDRSITVNSNLMPGLRQVDVHRALTMGTGSASFTTIMASSWGAA